MTEVKHNESTTVTVNTSNYSNDYHALNAMLNIYDENHRIQFNKDIEAEEAYIRSEIEPKTITFNSNIERIKYLIQNGYYDENTFNQYSDDELTSFYEHIDGIEYKFETFLGAFKFYSSYALKTFDGSHYLENFKQRCAAVALDLANGNIMKAYDYADDIISGRYQPATPTFLNCGKKQRGEGVSCFLLRIEDNMESIGRAINSALQLSKRGGGVALLLSNLRELGAPIKHIENQSSGVIPVMKILEDSFSYANQLGARQGAGAVYLSAHHPDILRFLDTKRENADEKIRIKSLSLGVVIPDITFKLAKENKEMALFSPYDVQREYGKPFADISITENYDDMLANDNIHKTYINARKFFTTIAELQFESGYPYIMFEDTVNKANPIEGRVNMSNLCSEILQVNTPSEFNEDLTYKTIGYDISCNLGSMNIAKTMHDGSNIGKTVNDAINMLTSLSEKTHINSVPSIRKANDDGHAIGLGQMNLHGFLASENIMYGSDEALDFTDKYFMMIAYYAYKASNEIAIRKGVSFKKFGTSAYNREPGHGNYFDKYVNGEMELTPHTEKIRNVFSKYGVILPTADDWRALQASVCEHGLYNMYLQAVPPTGSISYINHSTSSIHPIVSPIEIRKEGKLGRVYYPAPFLTNDNIQYFKDAYEIGPKAIIDTYAEATKHVDQGLSLTLFYKDTATTRDVNKNQIYAWRKGIKTLYYIRIRQQALEGTQVEGCVSCML